MLVAEDEDVVSKQEVISHAVTIVKNSKGLTIKTQKQYDQVVMLGKLLKSEYTTLENKRKSWVKPLNEQVKRLNDEFRDIIAMVSEGMFKLKSQLVAYEKIVAEKRLKKEQEAEAKAEAERVKLAKENEDLKRDAEQLSGGEKTQVLNEIEQNELQAETVIAAPVAVPELKTKGVSYRSKFTAKIIDKQEFIKWALEGSRLEYIVIDQILLNKEAQSTKGTRTYPGIKIIMEKVVSLRS